MRRPGAFALLSLLVGCAAPPAATPQSSATSPLVAPAPKIDHGPVREMIEPFLAARWAYDADGIYDFLTKEDQANPWRSAMTSPANYSGEPQKAEYGEVGWQVLDIEMGSDVATVQVDVTSTTMMAHVMLKQRSALNMIKFQRWLMKDIKARMGTQPHGDFVPERSIVTHSYRLERIGGDWKVVMGWPEAQRILEMSDADERAAALAAFRGSEKKSLIAALEHRYQPKLSKETAALLKAIDSAEEVRANEGYLRALVAYDELIADSPNLPEFVLERRNEFERLSDAQTAHMASAKLSIGRMKLEKKGANRVLTVTITNNGPDLTNAAIAVPAPTKRQPNRKYTQFTQALQAGETKVVPLKRYDVENGVPDAPVLVDVWYKDQALQRAHPRKEDPEFTRKRQDLQSGGRSRGTLTRDASRIREQVKAFDVCRGDEGEPLDLLVAINETGQATASAERPQKYVDCLQDVVHEIEFDGTGQSRRVIVRLLPPTHWSRD